MEECKPVLELPTRLGWQVNFSKIFFPDPPYLVMQLIPVLPCCNEHLAERGIVFDLFDLIASVRRPGAYQILTGDCGYAPDVYIEGMIFVSHHDDDMVVWELGVKAFLPALDDCFALDEGFIRLRFQREEYEADVRAMLREVQTYRSKRLRVADLSETVFDLHKLSKNYLDVTEISVGEFEPNCFESLLELDAEALWPREPIWPSGTELLLGFFPRHNSHEFLQVDGRLPMPSVWLPHFFTRWYVRHTFNNWLAWVDRGFWPSAGYQRAPEAEQNRYFLRHESDRAVCDAAGHALAAVLQACYAEGETAPGVTVRYQGCDLAVAKRVGEA